MNVYVVYGRQVGDDHIIDLARTSYIYVPTAILAQAKIAFAGVTCISLVPEQWSSTALDLFGVISS